MYIEGCQILRIYNITMKILKTSLQSTIELNNGINDRTCCSRRSEKWVRLSDNCQSEYLTNFTARLGNI